VRVGAVVVDFSRPQHRPKRALWAPALQHHRRPLGGGCMEFRGHPVLRGLNHVGRLGTQFGMWAYLSKQEAPKRSALADAAGWVPGAYPTPGQGPALIADEGLPGTSR